MDLSDYLEAYRDMNDTANHFEEIGKKHHNQTILNSITRFNEIYRKAVLVTDLLEAEAYYNELRGELFECEEAIEEDNLSEE